MKRLLIVALVIAGISAAGCIVRFGTLYEDTSSNTHFVALASNLTKADIVAAYVQVDFFDGGNRLLATEFVSPCTRTLQDHSDSPIEAILPAGVTVDHVQTTLKPVTFGTKDVADLDVDNVDIETSAGTTHITGDINNGDTDLFAVQVCAALLDDDDNVLKVGRVFTDPTNIDNDESATFDIAVQSDDDAAQYQLWVDAITHNPSDFTAPVVVGPADIEATPTPTKTATPGTPTTTATPTITSTPNP